MKSATNKKAVLTADHSLLPAPESFCFPGCHTDLKGTAYTSEERLSSS